MPRKKRISDSEILIAKEEISKGNSSLRNKAKELGMHPSSLSERIHKINNQIKITQLSKPNTKPDTSKVKSISKPDILDKILFTKETKPDTKPDIKRKKHLSISLLRGLHELLLGYSDQHKLNRKELLETLIKEFEKQKESIK